MSTLISSRIRHAGLRNKLVPVEETLQYFTGKQVLGFSGFTGVGYPKSVPQHLCTQWENKIKANPAAAKDTPKFRLLSGASTGSELENRMAALNMIQFRAPFQSAKTVTQGINSGKIDFMDEHLFVYSQELLYGYFGGSFRPQGGIDVAIIEATAIDETGGIVPGASVGASAELAYAADKIIVEVNTSLPSFEGLHDISPLTTLLPPHRQPFYIQSVSQRLGRTSIHIDTKKVVAVVQTSCKDEPAPAKEDGDHVSDAIANHLLEFFHHEIARGRIPNSLLPIQSGVGNIANAVIGGLVNDPQLSNVQAWTEVLQDTMLDFFDTGKLTFASATSIRLSQEKFDHLYSHFADYNSKILLRSQQISNCPEIINRLGVIACNTPIEIDIYGHANSTCVNGSRLISGIGGSGDFLRNARLAIMHTPSTRPTPSDPHGISCIVPMCSHVDHTEHDIDVFVTEHGLADVRGLSPSQRAAVIVEKCAHPLYKPILQEYINRAKQHCMLNKSMHEPHNLQDTFKLHINLQKNGTMRLKSWD